MSLVFYFKLFGILIPILAIIIGIAMLIVYVHWKVGAWLSILMGSILFIALIVALTEFNERVL